MSASKKMAKQRGTVSLPAEGPGREYLCHTLLPSPWEGILKEPQIAGSSLYWSMLSEYQYIWRWCNRTQHYFDDLLSCLIFDVAAGIYTRDKDTSDSHRKIIAKILEI